MSFLRRAGFASGAALFGLGLSLLSVEGLLRVFAPTQQAATIGHREARTAALYGWGYDPGESFGLVDPDTGRVIVSRANNRGWRDLDHAIEKNPSTFRILVLGDSNTFAPLVNDDAMYPRVLERELKVLGIDAEVISMGYGGWSTDQQLEALTKEGLAFKPNLVILQFCNNDLPELSEQGAKPFRYELGRNGELVRTENPPDLRGANAKTSLKRVAESFEIFKRSYKFYLWVRLVYLPGKVRYMATSRRAAHVPLVLGPASMRLARRLAELPEGPVEEALLRSLVKELGVETFLPVVLRIYENRWFQKYSPRQWVQDSVSPSSPEWKLFEALLSRMSLIARTGGARFAVFNETELGHYEWEREWHRVSGDPEVKKRFLQFDRLLERAASRVGADFIEMRRPITRARNDPHANAAGNQAMALNILDYLLDRRGQLFKKGPK